MKAVLRWGFFFAVDDRWNYEYRKVIELPTYPMQIKYNTYSDFYNNHINNSESYLWIVVFFFYSSHLLINSNNCSSGNAQNNELFQREIDENTTDEMMMIWCFALQQLMMISLVLTKFNEHLSTVIKISKSVLTKLCKDFD